MRIAIVHSFYSSRQPSGENGVVEAEVAALRRAGHEVALVAARTDDLEREPLYGIRAAARVATGLGRSPLGQLRRLRPDVVHVHNLFPNFGRRWAAELDVPLVATLHNFRPVCASGILYRGGEICTLCPDGDRFAGLRHRCYRGSAAATLPLAWANRRGPAVDPLLARADRLVMLSELAVEQLARVGIDRRKVVLWSNFLPDDLDPGPTPPQAAPDGWLYVGRLAEEKGIGLLARTWPRGRALRIVGEGPAADEVRRAMDANSSIEALGRRSREEVVALMQGSLGLVVPSRWFEAFPLVYAEAMAAGLPVLAWRPNAVAERVTADGTGAATSWGENLGPVLDAAEAEVRSLLARCRAVFEQRYGETAYVARATALYGELTRAADAPG